MERIFAFVLTAALLLTLCASSAHAEDTASTFIEPTLSKDASPYDAEHPENLETDQLIAHSAILMEADSGKVIYEKNAYEIMYPASTTKIMTLLLGILMIDDLEDTAYVSDYAVTVPSDSSTMGLTAGEEITCRDLFYGTMMLSGNDGANVIAEKVSGSSEAFVQLMNEAAATFGMKNTHFANPHGLYDPDHYTTAYDLALLTRIAMQNELFADIVGTVTYTIAKTNIHRAHDITTRSRNLIPSAESSENKYYYEFANGVKTGFHSQAGYCFVGSAEKDGVKLISVVLYTSDRGRWNDTKKLFEYGFSQYESVTPVELYNMNPITIESTNYSLSDVNTGKVPLICTPADPTDEAHITATHDEIERMAKNLRKTVLITYTRGFAAPIQAGEVIGTMTYFDENGKDTVYNLTASRSVAKRENAPKSLDEIYAQADADTSVPVTIELILLSLSPIAALAVLVLVIRWIVKRRSSRVPRTPKPKSRYFK